MINSGIVKSKIDDKLIDTYLSNGINPISKIIELSKIAEDKIKTTNDAMMLINHYKEISNLTAKDKNIKERVEFINTKFKSLHGK